MELNAEQRAVVDSLQENILLTASVGTGKTNTMAARIARVVEEEIPVGGCGAKIQPGNFWGRSRGSIFSIEVASELRAC